MDKRLVIVREEAEIIEFMYKRYLECGNLTEVARECRTKGFRSKTWMPSTGILQVGVPILAATVRNMLMNPIYAGYLSADGKLHRGVHKAIISHQLWQKVAELREEQIAMRAKDAPERSWMD